MHLRVLFSFIDLTKISPDVVLILFLRKLRYFRFSFCLIEMPSNSPPESLIKLFERSSRSSLGLLSMQLAKALAVASPKSQNFALRSLKEVLNLIA